MDAKIKKAEQLITKHCGDSSLAIIDYEIEKYKSSRMPKKYPGEDEAEYAIRVITSGSFLALLWDIQSALASHVFKRHFNSIRDYFR